MTIIGKSYETDDNGRQWNEETMHQRASTGKIFHYKGLHILPLLLLLLI